MSNEDLDQEGEIKQVAESVMNKIIAIFRIMNITPEMAVFCLESLASHLRKENPEIPEEFPVEAVIE